METRQEARADAAREGLHEPRISLCHDLLCFIKWSDSESVRFRSILQPVLPRSVRSLGGS